MLSRVLSVSILFQYVPRMPEVVPLLTMSDPGRPPAGDIVASGAERAPFRLRDHPRWAALLLGVLLVGAGLLAADTRHRRDAAEVRASALQLRAEHIGGVTEGTPDRPKESDYVIGLELHDDQNREFLLAAVSFQGLDVPLTEAVAGATTRQRVKLHVRGCAAVGQLPAQLLLKVTTQRPGHRQVEVQVPVDAAGVHQAAQQDCEQADR